MSKLQIKELLLKARDKKASDIHMMVDDIYFRVNGELEKEDYLKLSNKEIIKFICEMKGISEDELDNDMDFIYEGDEVGRNRVNAIKQMGNYKLTIRVLNEDTYCMEELGIPPIMKELVSKSSGLLLITGTTGSGKSTTMSSLIDYVNKNYTRSITTIEDPVEYTHKNNKSLIVQREIGQDTTYSAGLRSALRQDPNIIVIGEMRDKETIEVALTAAETGHLVISTLHTNDCVGTVDRLLDVFPPEHQSRIASQLSTTLIGIFSQRLVPTVKKGRALVYELLVPDTAIRHIIRKMDNVKIMQSMPSSQGSIMQKDVVDRLVIQGKISRSESVNIRKG